MSILIEPSQELNPNPERSRGKMPTFNTKDVTEPKEGLVVYKDAYWLCVNGDPKQALFFGNSPQCNKNIKVQEWAMKQDQYAKRGDLKIVLIEAAFVPQRN